jgi:hypothetical protein
LACKGPENWGYNIAEKARRAVSLEADILETVGWKRKGFGETQRGRWDDSFQHAFRFKAEVEKTNPGSLVDIECEKVRKKEKRFTRMFVSLKACVDGFMNGCRPFLGVDSTNLTGKWKGQLASATTIGCFQCVMVCLDQRQLEIGNGFSADFIKLLYHLMV